MVHSGCILSPSRVKTTSPSESDLSSYISIIALAISGEVGDFLCS
jgi:hypothetical protein